MVAGPGIEPGTVAYETTVLPLHYPAADQSKTFLFNAKPSYAITIQPVNAIMLA